MTTVEARPPYAWLYRSPRTAALLTGMTISAIGDGAAAVALPLLALQLHGSLPAAVAIAAVAATAYIVPVAISLSVGLGRRRFDPRAVLTIDAIARAAVFGVVGVLGVSGRLSLAAMIGLLLAGSGLRLLASTGRRLIVMAAAGSSGALAANGVLGFVDSLALFGIGPALGGLVSTVWSPSAALVLTASTYAVLAVTVAALAPRTPPTSTEPARSTSGWRVMRHARVVLLLLAVVFLFDLLYGPVEVALPLLVTVDLGRGAGTLGLAWAVFGVGAVISSAATGALGRFRAVGVLIVIIVAWGSCDALLGAAPGAGVVIAVMGFGGLVYGPFTAIAYTLLHRLVNRDDQAAVFAVWSGVLALSLPIGLALGGPLVALAGTRMALVIVGLLTVGLVPIAAAWLRRTGSGDPEPVVVP
jgi:hypothetical protein